MWAHYRKTFIWIQLAIVAICVGLIFFFKAPWPSVLVMFAAMQVFAVLGAWWAMRLKRKVAASREDRLPLSPRF